MIEDKLGPLERIRLQSLAQSVAANSMRGASAEKIVSDARAFEEFIIGVQR